MIYRVFSAVAAVATLSACGGGSTGEAGGAASFGTLAARGDAIADAYANDLQTGNYANLTQLPRSGELVYRGYGGYLIDPVGTEPIDSLSEADLMSQVTMTLALRDDSISGFANNFYLKDGNERMTGRLSIDADLDRTANTQIQFGILGEMTGTLQSPSVGAVTVNTTIAADLYGSDSRVLAGFVDGTANSAQGTSVIEGGIVLER